MTDGSEVGLEKRREFLVYAVIFIIIGGALFDIITQREHWPFSPYSMFSTVRRDYSLTRLRLFGLTDIDSSREIPLTDPKYIQPLGDKHIQRAMSIKKKPDNVSYEQYLEETLHHILTRYEVLRIAGDHDGPELHGIRLYRYQWKLDPWIRNVERPDHRELILEVREPRKE
jgi:hypothetical protein